MDSESNFFHVFFSLLLALFHFLLLLCQDHPIVLIVILVTVSLEQVFEHVLHGTVLRPFIKSQVPALAQILGEFDRVSLAKSLNGSCKLLLFNSLILVPFVVGLESLPRKHSS